MNRTKFIGASEVAGILGVSPYPDSTPLHIWAIKVGEVEAPDLSDNEAVEWGTRLERVVSEKFSEKHDVKLIARKKRYIHPDYDYISCELDNIIAGTDELVEIKTVNSWSWKQWENPDELPNHVVLQVMTQLGLSNRKVGWVGCLCGGQKYIEKRVEFDQELYDTIIKGCVKFWDMVQTKTPPVAEASDNSFMIKLFPSANETMREASEDISSAIAALQLMKSEEIVLKEKKKGLEAKIKAVIGEAAGLTTPEYTVTWKNQLRASVDLDKIKADNLYDKYKKTSETRVMRVSKNKE